MSDASDPQDAVHYRIDHRPDRSLHGTVVLPTRDHWPAPVAVFCHGFKGFKDWGPWPWLAQQLADRGFVVNRFNFSLSGVGPNSERHDEPEKFARNTYGAEMEDLATIFERVDEWGVSLDALGPGRGVIGHSRGGMVALLAGGAGLPTDAIVTLGSPGHSRRHSEEHVAHWREQGYLEVPNVRTGQVLKIDVAVIDDYFAREEEYDVARQVASRDIPTLVIHGDGDETVGVEEADWIHDAIGHDRKSKVILPGAGHTFGAGHPFAKPTPALETVRDRAVAWLEQHLSESA